MNILNTLNRRLKIFTHRDRHEIPESAGTYAWFFPLHVFNDYKDAQDLADFYRKVFALDSLFSAESNLSEKQYIEDRHTRSWQSVTLKAEVTISPGGELPSDCQKIWEKVQSDSLSKSVFEESLIAASLFTPPLYIGKAKDLKVRYSQHIQDSGFKARFDSFSRSHSIPLEVHNLIFCCLSLDADSENLMSHEMISDSDGKDMNYLLEQILMKSARPPFSKQ